ncbi:MAG: minor capsid protein [Rhodobacterales bacterium]|nr:minor capsid protein [Rhodobacterales bacterium]
MNLDPIRDYLGSLIPSLVVARNLFTYTMPPTVSRGVLLVPSPVGLEINHEVGKASSGRYQVIVRSEDYTAGLELANFVSESLTLLNLDLGEYTVVYSRPRHTPISFPRSEGDQIEFSINFDVRIHPSS